MSSSSSSGESVISAAKREFVAPCLQKVETSVIVCGRFCLEDLFFFSSCICSADLRAHMQLSRLLLLLPYLLLFTFVCATDHTSRPLSHHDDGNSAALGEEAGREAERRRSAG